MRGVCNAVHWLCWFHYMKPNNKTKFNRAKIDEGISAEKFALCDIEKESFDVDAMAKNNNKLTFKVDIFF